MLDFRSTSFLTVCKYMNFTIAAKHLNLSQPAISQHIKYLEDKYSCTLFTRDKKNIALTDEGKLLFKSLKLMSNDEKKIKALIAESKKNKYTINFGLTMTIGEYTLLNEIINYVKSNKHINFNIFYKNTQTVLEYLDNGLLDFAIVEGHLNQDKYNIIKFKTEDFVGVCSSKHIFAKKIHNISDLLHERIIIREPGSGTLAMLKNLLSIKNLSINDFENFIQIDNMHTLVELIKNDCGISFLYKSAIQNEVNKKSISIINLNDFGFKHDFNFVFNKNSVFSDIYQNMIKDFLKLSH